MKAEVVPSVYRTGINFGVKLDARLLVVSEIPSCV